MQNNQVLKFYQFRSLSVEIIKTMGNQAAYMAAYQQQQQYQNSLNNWAVQNNPDGSGVPRQSHLPVQPTLPQNIHYAPTGIEKQNYYPQILPQNIPKIQKIPATNPGSQIKTPVSAVQPNVNPQQLQGSRIREQARGQVPLTQSFIPPQVQPETLPEIKLIFKPQVGKSGSIVNKNPTPNNRTFKFDSTLQKIDQMRISLREFQHKIIFYYKLFQKEIQEMDGAIELERKGNFKDKNRAMYILKQKKHYHKLCLDFKEFSDRNRSTLSYLRKRDTFQVTPEQFAAANLLREAIQSLVKNVEKDLPSKGWKTNINKPTSKYYLSVVISALQDPQIVKKYSELELSLSNPQVLNKINNEEMLSSSYRKIQPEETTEETAKKLIEGPAHYQNTGMRGTKYPVM